MCDVLGQRLLMGMVVLLSACGSYGGGSGGSAGTAGSAGGAAGSGGVGGAAGSDGGSQCNAIPDDALQIMPVCPGGTQCPDCSSHTGTGGQIPDGVYTMTWETVWASGCGSVENLRVRARLQVQGSTMQLVSE